MTFLHESKMRSIQQDLPDVILLHVMLAGKFVNNLIKPDQ